MKIVVISSSSSTTTTSSSKKSSTTCLIEDDRSKNRDSYYYPGCRKDANCNYEICLASINATLDVMPFSVQNSSLTKFSVSRPNRSVEHTPISFDASILSTPTSASPQNPVSSGLKSSAKLKAKEKMKKRERIWGFGCGCWRLILGLSLVNVDVCGFFNLVYGAFKPVMSVKPVLYLVRNVGEKSCLFEDLNGKIKFLQKEMENPPSYAPIDA